MKRRVRWSDKAAADYHDQLTYIADDSPTNAELVDKRIIAAIELLASRPIGRAGRVTGTYEKSVAGTSLIVAYILDGETLHILRIIHTSRNWPEGEWPKDGN
jgi:toxin ParE1/3/4